MSVILPEEAVGLLQRAGGMSADDARFEIIRACAANELYARGIRTVRNMSSQTELKADANDSVVPSFCWSALLSEFSGPDGAPLVDAWFVWCACELAATRSLPQGDVQEHWRAVVFDRDRLEALALRVTASAPAPMRTSVSVNQKHVEGWIQEWPGNNVEQAWDAFKRIPDFKGYKREAFRDDWRSVTGKIGRGARTSRHVAAANFGRS